MLNEATSLVNVVLIIKAVLVVLVLYLLCTTCANLFYLWKYSCVSIIVFSWTNTNNQAGETFTANISLTSSGGEPLKPEQEEKLLSYLKITVKYDGEVVNEFTSFGINNKILAVHLKRAGQYEFCCSYTMLRTLDFQFNGATHTKNISSGRIDASQTEFNGQMSGKIVVVSQGVTYYLAILIKDRYKNICSVENVDFRLFSFEHHQLDRSTCTNKNGKVLTTQIYHEFNVNNYGDLCLILHIPFASIWEGKIYYNRQLIKGGEFDIVVITNDEENKLSKIVNENIGVREPRFEGFSEIIGHNFIRRYVRIYIGLSPTKLMLFTCDGNGQKNKFATYNISSRTKLLFRDVRLGDGQLIYCLVIQDDINEQFPFLVYHSEGRTLLALYFHYQAHSENKKRFSLETKKNIFFQELALQSTETSLKTHTIRVSQHKDRIVQTTFEQLTGFSRGDWKDRFSVCFDGQPLNGTLDLSTWFSIIMDAIFSESSTGAGMFTKYEQSKYVHPTPVNCRDNFKWRPEYYHLAGRILGKYLIELSFGRIKTPVFKAFLSRSLLSRLLGLMPTYEDLRLDGPLIFKKRVLPVLQAEDVSTLGRNFSEDFDCLGNYLEKPVDLVPSGSNIKVTNANRERYLSCLANYYLSTTAWDEIHALRTGFFTMIPEDLLTILDAEDLETILKCGKETAKPGWFSWLFGTPKPKPPNEKPATPWETCREERGFVSNGQHRHNHPCQVNGNNAQRTQDSIFDLFKPRKSCHRKSSSSSDFGLSSLRLSEHNYRIPRERRFGVSDTDM